MAFTRRERTALLAGVVLLGVAFALPQPHPNEDGGADFPCRAVERLHVKVLNGTVTGHARCGGATASCTPVRAKDGCIAQSAGTTATSGSGRCAWQAREKGWNFTVKCWSGPIEP